MEHKKDIEKLLESYFQKKQLREESLRLQEKIALQTYQKHTFSWQRFAIPVAATILLIIGVSVWTDKQKTAPVQLAQKEIIYEDEDLMIYIKEEVATNKNK